jgi:hypothetical protein
MENALYGSAIIKPEALSGIPGQPLIALPQASGICQS